MQMGYYADGPYPHPLDLKRYCCNIRIIVLLQMRRTQGLRELVKRIIIEILDLGELGKILILGEQREDKAYFLKEI